MKIWQNIDSFDADKGSFKTWVAGVSKFNAIDYQRKYIKELQHISLDEVTTSSDIISDITESLNNQIDELLSHLSEQDKKLFLEIYVEERKVKEVGLEMQLKDEVIYNRLSRAKSKLRRLFGGRTVI